MGKVLGRNTVPWSASIAEQDSVQFSSVQSLSRVLLFATPWTTARQASLSITNSWSLLRLMSIESVMPSNNLFLCCPHLLLPSIFPSIRVFQMSQFFPSCAQSIGVLASASVLPVNIQDWFPLGWTGWISLQSKDYWNKIHGLPFKFGFTLFSKANSEMQVSSLFTLSLLTSTFKF